MGWVVGYASKEEALNAALGESRDGVQIRPGYGWEYEGNKYEVLARKDAAGCVWLLIAKNGVPTIFVVRVAKRGGEWGQGGLWGETAGPSERGCPQSWLKKAPQPGGYSESFRKRMREEQAAKAASRKVRDALKVGQVVAVDPDFRLAAPCTVARVSASRVVVSDAAGKLWRVPLAGVRLPEEVAA